MEGSFVEVGYKLYRKQGIGKALILQAEEALQKEVYKIRLNTLEFQAREFYRQLGYKTVAIEKGFPEGYTTYYLHETLKKDVIQGFYKRK